jgi:hypothetical protein
MDCTTEGALAYQFAQERDQGIPSALLHARVAEIVNKALLTTPHPTAVTATGVRMAAVIDVVYKLAHWEPEPLSELVRGECLDRVHQAFEKKTP